jgi:hypothetical protein
MVFGGEVMMRAKSLFIYIALVIGNFVVNFFIYNRSFNIQATPYLHEEQRVESGLLMLKTTFPAYFVSSIFFAFLFYVAAKHFITKSSSGR